MKDDGAISLFIFDSILIVSLICLGKTGVTVHSGVAAFETQHPKDLWELCFPWNP